MLQLASDSPIYVRGREIACQPLNVTDASQWGALVAVNAIAQDRLSVRFR